MNRVARVARGVGALGLILALVAGIPWALWHFVGWPLPHHLPSAAQVGRALNRQGIPAQTLIDALAAVVWITWAVLVVSLAAEIPAAVAGRHARRLPLAGIFQPFTGPLVAAVLVAGLSLAPRAGHQGVTGGGALPATVHRPAATLVMRDAAFTNSTRRIATATATATGPGPGYPARCVERRGNAARSVGPTGSDSHHLCGPARRHPVGHRRTRVGRPAQVVGDLRTQRGPPPTRRDHTR